MKTKSKNAATWCAVCTLLASATDVWSQRVDTIYYDQNWKGVEHPQFASFVRYVSYPEDEHYSNRFVDYYRTGELHSEGECVSIDRFDDSKSLFGVRKTYYRDGQVECDYAVSGGNGSITSYYEDGHTKNYMELRGGQLNGTAREYYPSGLLKKNATFTNGKLNGLYSEFRDGGTTCIQVEYLDGEYSKPYYSYTNSEGYVSKYYIADNSLYQEKPSPAEKKVMYNDGVAWHYYQANGISLMLTLNTNASYGKFFQAYIILTNNTVEDITFDPMKIRGSVEQKGRRVILKAWSSGEYMQKVKSKQYFDQLWQGTFEHLAAHFSAYSTSTTNTTVNYAGSSAAAVIGTGGAAVGASGYAGSVSASSVTTSYNGAVAYQSHLIAENRMNEYRQELLQEARHIEAGYLRKSTVPSGQTISGYINLDYVAGASNIFIDIPVNSIVYQF